MVENTFGVDKVKDKESWQSSEGGRGVSGRGVTWDGAEYVCMFQAKTGHKATL